MVESRMEACERRRRRAYRREVEDAQALMMDAREIVRQLANGAARLPGDLTVLCSACHGLFHGKTDLVVSPEAVCDLIRQAVMMGPTRRRKSFVEPEEPTTEEYIRRAGNRAAVKMDHWFGDRPAHPLCPLPRRSLETWPQLERPVLPPDPLIEEFTNLKRMAERRAKIAAMRQKQKQARRR